MPSNSFTEMERVNMHLENSAEPYDGNPVLLAPGDIVTLTNVGLSELPRSFFSPHGFERESIGSEQGSFPRIVHHRSKLPALPLGEVHTIRKILVPARKRHIQEGRPPPFVLSQESRSLRAGIHL